MNRDLTLFVRLQRVQCLLHQFTAQVLFFGGRQLGIAGHVHDTSSQNDAVGADHFSDRQGGGDLNDGDAGLLQFGRDRSTAASTGSSRGREYDRIDALLFDLFQHLAAQAASV